MFSPEGRSSGGSLKPAGGLKNRRSGWCLTAMNDRCSVTGLEETTWSRPTRSRLRATFKLLKPRGLLYKGCSVWKVAGRESTSSPLLTHSHPWVPTVKPLLTLRTDRHFTVCRTRPRSVYSISEYRGWKLLFLNVKNLLLNGMSGRRTTQGGIVSSQ